MWWCCGRSSCSGRSSGSGRSQWQWSVSVGVIVVSASAAIVGVNGGGRSRWLWSESAVVGVGVGGGGRSQRRRCGRSQWHRSGFLQLKNQVKPISLQKSSTINPIVKSLLSQNLLRCSKAQKLNTVDPMPKFQGDLHNDLELVYVGQVCLSWEILHWQHRKAQELLQYDNHRYNAVAAKFQLFQVLLQRFIEDDPFQGPRMQHYVRSRCALCSILQVPAIRDDHRKDKKHGMGDEDKDLIIASDMLVRIIEESMQIYWSFLRGDDRSAVLRRLHENQVEHKDLELLIDIRKDLQKKEKRLKDIQRSGNCVVRKFHKQQQHQDQNCRLEHCLWLKLS